MAIAKVSIGSTVLPDGIVSIKRGDELLWSEGTGRAAVSGLMVGSVIAQKMTFTVKWGVITQADYDAIRAAATGGFFNLRIELDGAVTTMAAYRGSITAEHLGTFGGVGYWKGVTVDFVER